MRLVLEASLIRCFIRLLTPCSLYLQRSNTKLYTSTTNYGRYLSDNVWSFSSNSYNIRL
ncbi:hypothetical protein [Candidatus Hodgkinia cicadicola]|uniref:hypothetical protein n=1 Tax=Candidatus Hodgkinia cicadicola TaxID=573658 RepID=UPI001788A364